MLMEDDPQEAWTALSGFWGVQAGAWKPGSTVVFKNKGSGLRPSCVPILPPIPNIRLTLGSVLSIIDPQFSQP